MGKKTKELTEKDYELIAELAEKTGLNHDGGEDNRLFDDSANIYYDVSLMSEAQFDKLEKDLADFTVKGPGFEVSGWNDSSGYEYWKERGEAGDHNYIQITAYITDPTLVKDPDSIKNAVDDVKDHFAKWNNLENETDENTSIEGLIGKITEVNNPEDMFQAKNLSQFEIEDIEKQGFTLVETLFCDSSGFGSPYERAMTKTQATAKAKELIDANGKMYAALTGVGQFQVYVSLFKKNKETKKKAKSKK